MTREEAIKTIRLTCPKISDSECDFETAMRFLIPELAESEDERIRRKMIEHFKSKTKETWCNMPVKDIISYLEKQKEFVSEDFEIIWEAEDCKTLLDEGGKLSPRFKEMFKEVCHSWYDKGIEVGEKQKEQKPVEWSEEDEKIFQSLILEVNKYVFFAGIKANKIVSFLSSLRPSWKPSEVCYGVKGDPDPAGVWKPTEEQIKAIESCFCEFGEGCPDEDGLRSLYNDLKKLI